MLHAFERNKSRAYARYQGVREDAEPRVSEEDEITSLVFGPLDFLSASDNWHMWKQVLQANESRRLSGSLPADFFSDTFIPATCTQSFWPRKDGIEPDLHVRFTDASGLEKSILVELKWGAPLSGSDQLEKQWTRYQSGMHANSLHVFMARQLTGLPSDALWRDPATGSSRLRAARWHEFKYELLKLANAPAASAPLKRWSLLTTSFLRQVGILPFVGFHATTALANASCSQDCKKHHVWTFHSSGKSRL